MNVQSLTKSIINIHCIPLWHISQIMVAAALAATECECNEPKILNHLNAARFFSFGRR